MKWRYHADMYILRNMNISRRNIQWAPAEKESDNNSEEQEPVGELKPMIKRISLTYSTEQAKLELEVGDEKEPVFTKEIRLKLRKLFPATPRKYWKRRESTSKKKRCNRTFSQRRTWMQKAWTTNLPLYHTIILFHFLHQP